MKQEQTAQFIFSLAKKLQEQRKERVQAIYKSKLYSLAEKQRFAVQELPTVEQKSADLLLRRIGSVRRVFAATEGELIRAKGFGEKRAREISEFLDKRYLTSTL